MGIRLGGVNGGGDALSFEVIELTSEGHVGEALEHVADGLELIGTRGGFFADLFMTTVPIAPLTFFRAIFRKLTLGTLVEFRREILRLPAAEGTAGVVADLARSHRRRGIFVPIRHRRRHPAVEFRT